MEATSSFSHILFTCVFLSYKFFVTVTTYVQVLRSPWVHIMEGTTIDKCLSKNIES